MISTTPHKATLLSKHFITMYTSFQKQPTGVFCKTRCSQKSRKLHRKTPVLESIFNKVTVLQAWSFNLKETPTRVFSCEIFKNLKNTYFEDHLGTTVPECSRKINPLLVLVKPMLDGKRHNWVTNTFYCKYKLHKVGLCNIHVIPKCLMLFLSGPRRETKW